MSIIYYEIGTFDLAKWRKANNLTIRQFAKKAKIHFTYISRLENQKSIASPDMWEKIRKVIN